jgi:Zn-dependent M28 family amino/carboxypeptidase
VPVFEMQPSVARRLLAAGTRLRVKVDAATVRTSADNVLADLPGTGKAIMAGGHLDSVMDGPGLNDNGTGVAALLEVAERLPAQPRKAPVRLAFWTAEEYGLLGSVAYGLRLGQTRVKRTIGAYINLDMVGSPNGITEVYDSDDALERRLRALLPGDEGETVLDSSSDHAVFEQFGVPITGIYTGSGEAGPDGDPRDPCYHRACDGLDNVDRETTAAAATATATLMAELAAR